MKHAILILAHRDISELLQLIKYFSYDCFIYIHIDRRRSLSQEEHNQLDKNLCVRQVCQEFAVHWGGFSVLQAELRLLSLALSDEQADYIHLISGQDYPIKPLPIFLNFFELHKGISYVEYQQRPVQTWSAREQWRYRYLLPFDRVNARSRNGGIYVTEWILQQQKCGFYRRLPDQFPLMFKGSQWFSISRNAAQILMEYTTQHPEFLQRMKYTFAPEETYVPTVLVNLLPQNQLVNNNLRYIRWNGENGSNPSNLSIEHFIDIAHSNAFFARKMCSPYSDSLKDEINKKLLCT